MSSKLPILIDHSLQGPYYLEVPHGFFKFLLPKMFTFIHIATTTEITCILYPTNKADQI